MSNICLSCTHLDWLVSIEGDTPLCEKGVEDVYYIDHCEHFRSISSNENNIITTGQFFGVRNPNNDEYRIGFTPDDGKHGELYTAEEIVEILNNQMEKIQELEKKEPIILRTPPQPELEEKLSQEEIKEKFKQHFNSTPSTENNNFMKNYVTNNRFSKTSEDIPLKKNNCVDCSQCTYHNWDWYPDDGDEFEVCEKSQELYPEDHCKYFEEL